MAAALATLKEEEGIKDTGADSTAVSTIEEDAAGGACIDTSTMATVVRLPGFAAVNDVAANVPSTAVVVAGGTGDTGDSDDDGGGGGSGGVVLHFVVVVVVVVGEEEEDEEEEDVGCRFAACIRRSDGRISPRGDTACCCCCCCCCCCY